MSPPRLRLWTMLVAVEILAILVIGLRMRSRITERRTLARRHATEEAELRAVVAECRAVAVAHRAGRVRSSGITPDRAEAIARRLEMVAIPYHAKPRLKYEQAARDPWLAVEPDPPAPE
jgi:hypothetical protein